MIARNFIPTHRTHLFQVRIITEVHSSPPSAERLRTNISTALLHLLSQNREYDSCYYRWCSGLFKKHNNIEGFLEIIIIQIRRERFYIYNISIYILIHQIVKPLLTLDEIIKKRFKKKWNMIWQRPLNDHIQYIHRYTL